MIGKVLAGLCGAGILVSWRLGGPEWHVFQSIVFALFLLTVVKWIGKRVAIEWSWAFTPMLLIAAWPGVQLLAGISVYPYATIAELLRWSTYAVIFILAATWFRQPRQTQWLLRVTVNYSLLLAVVSIMQHFAGNGRVFWAWDAGVTADMGPFLNRDHYSAYMVLVMPLALWQAVADPRRRYLYILAAAAMYASVIASASRAGAVLVTAEMLFCLFIADAKESSEGSVWRRVAPILATIVVSVTLVFVVGWGQLIERYQISDPYIGRREFALASIQMVQKEPLTGFGMGTWSVVYPAFATIDFGKHVNAAHNDWLQWGAEGGLPLLALFLVLFSISVGICWPAPWAVGIPAVFLHCLVEFPLGDGRYFPAAFFLLYGVAAGVAMTRKGPRWEYRPYSVTPEALRLGPSDNRRRY